MKPGIFILFSMIAEASAGHFVLNDTLLDFTHQAGNSGDFYYPEIVGSGVASLDYDKDGDMDIFFVQSGNFRGQKSTDKLFKNLLVETGKLDFKEVSKSQGVDSIEYAIGIAVADVNQDGWQDVFLAQLNENRLYLNQSGSGFNSSVSFSSDNSWSASASFCDINNDGWKDLYVANYVQWSETNHPKCFNSKSKRDYCGPASFKGWKDQFYLNVGGELKASTAEFFKEMPQMPGMNVICRDINSDGFQDFIVANDGEKNLVWLNQKGTSFKEYGLFSGLAVNSEGKPEASMGLASADFDLDGDVDVFFTHLMDETNTLYENSGKGFFQDVSNRSGLATESKPYTGWATGFLHVNDDIYPDLLILNGAVSDTYEFMNKSSLAQSNQLFLGGQNKKFEAVTEPSFSLPKSTRGASFADIDNDGDIDVIVNNNNDKAELLINQLNPVRWQGFVIKSKKKQLLEAKLQNNLTQTQQLLSLNNDGSYASANDPRIVINRAQLEKFNELVFLLQGQIIKTVKLNNGSMTNSYIELVIE